MIERLHEIFELPITDNILLFAFMLVIIFVIPIISRKLHIPQVIGLILCGVLFGPHALHVVDNTGAVALLSTIGLQYIMFSAGLELDINQFQVNKHKSFFFGFLTWLVPLVCIFPICKFGFGLDTLSSFLVGSMFGTHTLIAYPAVSRLGVARDPAVAVAVGGTIIVDAFVLILLAVILGLHTGNTSVGFWLQLGCSLVVFGAIMAFVVPRIGEWFFAHWHNERYIRYTFVIFMVFLSALFAEIAGLEGIIGSFAAGLVLNRFIPHKSELMHEIEFVGNALFIPFFLFTVGMLVDLRVILSGSAVILLALILSLTALLGKFGAAWVMQKVYGYSCAQRNVMFGLSSARVAATLAVGLVAHKAGLIDDIFINATILLILLTSIAGSLTTEFSAKKLAFERENGSSMPHHHNKGTDEHILIPLSNPDNAPLLAAFTDIFRSPLSSHPATFLSVVPDNEHAEKAIKSFNRVLSSKLRDAAQASAWRVAATIDPSLSDAISRVAREQLASILLLGWPKSDLAEKFIGEKWLALAMNLNHLTMWLDLPTPFTQSGRLVIMTYHFAEKDWGFEDWFDKITFLATQLSKPIMHLGEDSTSQAMQERIRQTQVTIPFSFKNTSAFNLAPPFSEVFPSDWLIVAAPRPRSLCSNSQMEHLPGLLSHSYKNHNKILVFPAQEASEFEPSECTLDFSI